jgi:hypothetical protein
MIIIGKNAIVVKSGNYFISSFVCDDNHHVCDIVYTILFCIVFSFQYVQCIFSIFFSRHTKYVCWACYTFFCSTCYDGDRRVKEMERRDSSKHPTFLRCSNTCSFTLQIPAINEINKNNNSNSNYTITLELRFEKLPLIGNLQSLLRFSIPDISNARKIHRTSVYLNGDGIIVGRPIERDGSINDNDNNNNVDKESDFIKSDNDNDDKKNSEKHNEGNSSTAIDDTLLPASIDTTTIVVDKDTISENDTTTSTNHDDNNRKDCKDKEMEPVSDDNLNTNVLMSVSNNEKKMNTVRIRAGIWSIVSVVVNPMEGTLESYVDGKVR